MAEGKIFSDAPPQSFFGSAKPIKSGSFKGTSDDDSFFIQNGGSNITVDGELGNDYLFVGNPEGKGVPSNVSGTMGLGDDKAEIYAVNGANIKQGSGRDTATIGYKGGTEQISRVKIEQGADDDELIVENNFATGNAYYGGEERDGSDGNDRVYFNVPSSRHEILEANSVGVKIRDRETGAINTYDGYEKFQYSGGTELTLAQIREEFAKSGTSYAETSQTTPTLPLTTAGLAQSKAKAPGE